MWRSLQKMLWWTFNRCRAPQPTCARLEHLCWQAHFTSLLLQKNTDSTWPWTSAEDGIISWRLQTRRMRLARDFVGHNHGQGPFFTFENKWLFHWKIFVQRYNTLHSFLQRNIADCKKCMRAWDRMRTVSKWQRRESRCHHFGGPYHREIEQSPQNHTCLL